MICSMTAGSSRSPFSTALWITCNAARRSRDPTIMPPMILVRATMSRNPRIRASLRTSGVRAEGIALLQA